LYLAVQAQHQRQDSWVADRFITRPECPILAGTNPGGWTMSAYQASIREIIAARDEFEKRGIRISLPYDGDLDDEERERFEALCAALAAAAAVREKQVSELRCDECGNGIDAEWSYCPWCSSIL
jgi:hypothetical protein